MSSTRDRKACCVGLGNFSPILAAIGERRVHYHYPDAAFYRVKGVFHGFSAVSPDFLRRYLGVGQVEFAVARDYFFLSQELQRSR